MKDSYIRFRCSEVQKQALNMLADDLNVSVTQLILRSVDFVRLLKYLGDRGVSSDLDLYNRMCQYIRG